MRQHTLCAAPDFARRLPALEPMATPGGIVGKPAASSITINPMLTHSRAVRRCVLKYVRAHPVHQWKAAKTPTPVWAWVGASKHLRSPMSRIVQNNV